MIYDFRGKCIGFNDNESEAREVAAVAGGHVEITEVPDNDNNYSGSPYCGSYEGDWQECPECGHGQ